MIFFRISQSPYEPELWQLGYLFGFGWRDGGGGDLNLIFSLYTYTYIYIYMSNRSGGHFRSHTLSMGFLGLPDSLVHGTWDGPWDTGHRTWDWTRDTVRDGTLDGTCEKVAFIGRGFHWGLLVWLCLPPSRPPLWIPQQWGASLRVVEAAEGRLLNGGWAGGKHSRTSNPQ